MSGRSGVYRKVVHRHALGNPRARRALVFILECGHARTGVHSQTDGRMWCGICTAESLHKRKTRVTYSVEEFEKILEREVARRLKERGK